MHPSTTAKMHNLLLRGPLVQEYVMFRSNGATYPAMDVDSSSYLDNLWRATRSLFSAVLAIAPLKCGSNGDETREELFRLAGEIERMMPNQAAELRYLAR
jgi:hypothetical protein